MTARTPDAPADRQAPFGTQPRRPMGLLAFLGLLYVCWLLLLLWIAISQTGN